MYAVYRELHPPTGVEHCLECNFFDENQLSLVVASTSVLRIYNLSEVRFYIVGFSGGSRRLHNGLYIKYKTATMLLSANFWAE